MDRFHPTYEALYREARAEGSASNSFLQREMNLPYNVAAERIKAMQIDGILGREPDRRWRFAVIDRPWFW